MGFFLDGKHNYILFKYFINKKKHAYSTKIKINRIDWDLKTQRPKKKKAFNKITDTLNEYQRAYNIMKEKYGNTLTNEIVRDEFDRYFKKKLDAPVVTVKDCFNKFLNEMKTLGNVSSKTVYKYENILNKVFMFKKDLNSFNEMNAGFYINLISYLRDTHKLSDNTLYRNLGFLRTFLNWCVKKGYSNNLEHKEHSVSTRETSHVALTESELKLIEEVELSENLSFYRDVFLMGVYSGQRFSDYSQFSKAHLKGDHLEIRQEKTNSICYVPLHPKLKILLEKYNYSYKKISSQKFNEKIQEISRIAGIDTPVIKDLFYGANKTSETTPKWKRVSSHTARRTFVTLSNQRGMSRFDIQAVTGIKKMETLQSYIKDDDENLKNSVNKIWG